MSYNGSFGSPQPSRAPVEPAVQNITQTIYLLQAISVFTMGFLLIIALFINYIYRRKTRGNWLDDHFRWQIQTFWFSSVFYVIGLFFLLIPFIGWFIGGGFCLLATLVTGVRVIKGWMRFTRELPP